MPQVTPQADKEEAPTVLRHAVVGSIEKEIANVVPDVVRLSGDPAGKIHAEMSPQSRDVLHHEREWACVPHSGQEVPVEEAPSGICGSPGPNPLRFAKQARLLCSPDPRETLAGGTADDDRGAIGQGLHKLHHWDVIDVAVLGPAKDDRIVGSEGSSESICGSLVVLDSGDTFSSGGLESERHAACASEEVQYRGGQPAPPFPMLGWILEMYEWNLLDSRILTTSRGR